MKTYETCDDSVHRRLDALIGEYRGDLRGRGVTIALLFCHGGLTHGGYPALGLCKINPLKDRVEGKADATITFDGDRWGELSTRQQAALLHHELHHVLLDSKAKEQADDAGRPKLRLRKHDHQLGLFSDILRIYREDSVEWSLLEVALRDRDQRVLPGLEAAAGDDEPEDEPEDDDGPEADDAEPATTPIRRRRRA